MKQIEHKDVVIVSPVNIDRTVGYKCDPVPVLRPDGIEVVESGLVVRLTAPPPRSDIL